MPRSEEQIAADEALAEAIERTLRAYDRNTEDGLLTGFIVLTVHQGFEEDGCGNARYEWLTHHAMPWHSVIGLHEIGGMQLSGELEASFRPD